MPNERGRIREYARSICCLSRSASPEPGEPARQVLASGTPLSSTVPQKDGLLALPGANSSLAPLTAPSRGSQASLIAIPVPEPALPHSSSGPAVAVVTAGPAGPIVAHTVAVVPPAPNPVDDIFQEALKRHEQKLSPTHRQAFLNASATGLISIIEGLNDQHQKESSVRDAAIKVQGFLTVVDGYLAVVAICIQHNPDISSLVVGGLKLFVDIGRRYAGFFDKLNETMSTLAENLGYLARYERLYRDNADFRNAMCEAYGDLISFCDTVCGIFMDEDGTLSGRVSAKVLLRQLSSPLESIFDALNARFIEHIRKVERMGHILKLEKEDSKHRLEAVDKADRARGSLLSWLSKLEPEADLERIYAKRHGDTGTWLLRSTQLKNWIEADNHQLLWCYGSPGVGKSVLLSILVEKVSSQHLFDNRIGIAFFYFNFQNKASSQSEASVLSILLKQLCRRRTEFPDSLNALHKQSVRNDNPPSVAQLKRQLEEIAMTFDQVFLMVDALDECSISQRPTFLQYIKSLLGLGSGKLKIFVTSRPERDIEIEFTSAGLPVIQIEATKVADDITAYVSHELSHRTHPYFNLKDCPELRIEVQQVLLSKSNGMFLWVTCQLAHIYQQPSKEHIKRSLESLPDDMTGTYRRILDTIDGKPEAMRVIAKRALLWVMTAKRPLTPGELALAVAIEPTSTCLDDLVICGPQVAIDACGGLLVTEAGEVRPIHFTVQEFLQTDVRGIGSMEDSNAGLACSSLRYILFTDFKAVRAWYRWVPDIESFNQMAYIWGFWNQHVQCLSSPPPDDVQDLVRRLFSSPNRRTVYVTRTFLRNEVTVLSLCAVLDLFPLYIQLYPLDWVKLPTRDLREAMRDAARGGSVSVIEILCNMMNENDLRDALLLELAADGGHIGAVNRFLELGADTNAALSLHAAAARGNDAIVDTLLANGADVNIQGGNFSNALQAAAAGGYETIVDTLLAKGADVNISGGDYGNALQAAAVSGNLAIIDTLLAKGADVHIQGGYYGNALQAAAFNGNLEIIDTVLAKGADVNIQGGCYGNALQAAAVGGYEAIVETLLAKGADVHIQGGDHGNALQAAAVSGNLAIIDTLLAKGADVNIQGGRCGNALQAAAAEGYEAIVETLLAKGADIHIQGGYYGNALQAAAARGYEAIVETLIAKGADVHIQGGTYGNALQAAALNGNTVIVDTLLAKGADVNISGGSFGTALQAAAVKGNLAIIATLLAKGADVNIRGGYYGTALQAAAAKGNTVIVDTLLAKGADVHIQGGDYGNALQAAAAINGNLAIIETLLAKGVDVNIQGGNYGTALQGAAARGHEAIIATLLAKGADVHIQGGHYGNALQAAAVSGNLAIIDTLLAKGADINIQGGNYGNALQAAALNGNTVIVDTLLAKGADVNIQGGEFGNALQAAALNGNTVIVDTLLAKGADVNIQGGEFGTALQAAAVRGHNVIVDMLLTNGADVNIQGGKYGTAIAAARRNNCAKVVSVLLKHGAKDAI